MKTPISYYGGKQRLAGRILQLIPKHDVYTEPFVGGGAIFWAKEKSKTEIINDTNRELINFYECVQNEFVDLEKMVRISLHSRSLHNDANVVYNNPHMFSRIKRAWAVWVLSSQSFSSKLDGSFGYDRVGTKGKKVTSKRKAFTIDLSIRMQNVQVECTDALRVIRSRDNDTAFHYCDPPYYNSNCGHYSGYSINDFEELLKLLCEVKGKFILSSYPSDLLKKYTSNKGWHTKEIVQSVSVANARANIKKKKKTEVLTANFNF